MGFTGKYVTGVWLGNDNFRPTNHVTGGHLPAQTWQRFMSVAHKDMNIPTIPGLPIHPVQAAERQRLAALRLSDPSYQAESANNRNARPTSSLMPKRTRTALKKIARALRKAGGIKDEIPDEKKQDEDTQNNKEPKDNQPLKKRGKNSKKTDRRADRQAPSRNF